MWPGRFLGAGSYHLVWELILQAITHDNTLRQKVVWPHEQNYSFGIASLGFVLLSIIYWRCKSTFAKVFFANPLQ